jgi:DNA-binding transcriptional ArsR family regulator
MPDAAALDRTFSALADPTRRAIIIMLAKGEATVNELARPFDISLPAISRHLKVLEGARLIERERDGQFQRCRLSPRGLRDAAEWLEFYRDFWAQSLDRLDAHLKQEKSHGRRRRQKR